MSAINQDVLQFLALSAPFHLLSDELREYAAKQLKITYLSELNKASLLPELANGVCLIRKGLFDVYNQNNVFIERLEQGDCFGYSHLLTLQNQPLAESTHIKVVQDGLIYFLSAKAFDYLRKHNEDFERFFIAAISQDALTEYQLSQSDDWSLLSIDKVCNKNLVSIMLPATIQEAAALMAEKSVSSLLILDQYNHLQGIITDRDLRNRVLAKGLSVATALTEVITFEPIAIYHYQRVFDAVKLMTLHHIHHLPVLDDEDQPVGMLTNTDLAKLQRSEPIFFAGQLNQATDLTALLSLSKAIPDYIYKLTASSIDVLIIGHLLATFYDAITLRLIYFYQQENGPAPVEFAWLLFGSQAREEQTLSSDQDNGLLLADSCTAEQKQYFLAMADYVCIGLAQAGLRLCPGNIMASNPLFCLTLAQWQQQFSAWVDSPTAESVLSCNIFFDQRLATGDKLLFSQLQQHIKQVSKNQLFIATLANSSANVAVPLSIFNQFQFEQQSSPYINVKQQGLAIVNDIARVYALNAGVDVSASLARLKQVIAIEQGQLSQLDGDALKQAWLLFTRLRILSNEHKNDANLPSNCLYPKQLDALTQQQLKWAFKVLRQAQEALALKFARGAF